MKHIYFLLTVMLLAGQVVAQTSTPPVSMTSNLNLSKSNINRILYPAAVLTDANAQLLLADLEKQAPMNEADLKAWLMSNFKRFGVDNKIINQISVFTSAPAGDCKTCAKACPGRCIKTSDANCGCLTKPTADYTTAPVEKKVTYILVSTELLEDTRAMGRIATTVEALKATGTTMQKDKTASKPKE